MLLFKSQVTYDFNGFPEFAGLYIIDIHIRCCRAWFSNFGMHTPTGTAASLYRYAVVIEKDKT